MSGRVNTTAIGAFLVGTLACVIAAVFLFGDMGWLGGHQDRSPATVVFTGSVKGLNIGAPVTLRGVQVGEVMAVDVSWDAKAREFVIPVSVSLETGSIGQDPAVPDLEALIARGLRAQLKTQSLLTGLLYIDLDFLPGTEPRYVDFPTASAQIPTAPTELEAILQRVSDIDIQSFVQNIDETLRALNKLLANPATQDIPGSINVTLQEVATLARNIDSQVAALGGRVDTLAGSADATLVAVHQDVDALSRRVDGSLVNLDATLASVRGAADSLDYLASERSPLTYELSRSAAELGRASRALAELAGSLEREPEAVLRGRRAEP